MLRFARPLFASASLLALVLASESARAQTTGSESISTALPNPNRALYQNGQFADVTNSPRPQNLNPTGINFSDCAQDLKLTFSLILSGFIGGSTVEAWAGTGDCTAPGSRGVGTATQQLCWRVGPPGAVRLFGTPTAVSFDVYARDVLRYETTSVGTNSAGLTYDPSFHDPTNAAGYSACFAQGASDAAVTLTIWFVPVLVGSGTNSGTAYKYSPVTDLVAPPPPTVTSPLGVGNSLLLVNWTSPGNDPDIVGFSIFADPPGGRATAAGCNCGPAPGGGGGPIDTGAEGVAPVSQLPDQEVQYCSDATTSAVADAASDSSDDGPDSAVSEAGEASASVEGGSDGSADAVSDVGQAADASADGSDDGSVSGDSGCFVVNTSGGGSACQSFNLTSSVTIAEGGTTTPVATTTDDGSTPTATGDDGSSSAVSLAGGGVSLIPDAFKVGEIDDRGATSDTLTGLTNGINYVVVVASLDGSGNVGPPSTPMCGVPAPVKDFFSQYRAAGGQAGGSCALEGIGVPMQAPVFGLVMAGVALALLRRRKRP